MTAADVDVAALDVLVPTCDRPVELATTLAGLAAQTGVSLRVVSDQSGGPAAFDTPSVAMLVRALRRRGTPMERLRHLPRRGVTERPAPPTSAPGSRPGQVRCGPRRLSRTVRAGRAGRCTTRPTGCTWRVLAGSAGRGTVRALAARLAAAGVHAEIHGPRGRIATLDPRRHSRIGALVTGSPHIAAAPAAWPLVVRAGTPGAGGRTAAIAGSALVAVPLGVALRGARRS